MNRYSVNIYKTQQNDSRHNFNCLQKQFKISSWDPAEALAAAQQKSNAKLWEADCIEFVSEPQHVNDAQATQ